MLIRSVQTSCTYLQLLISELEVRCKDCRTLKPCLLCQVMQMKGNGSNTAQHLPQRMWHPHCLGLLCLLTLEYIGCGGRRPLAVHFLYCLGGHLSVQFPQKDTLFMCPWATDAKQSRGSDRDSGYKVPSWFEQECSGDTHSKDARAVCVWDGKSPSQSGVCCTSSAKLPLASVLVCF